MLRVQAAAFAAVAVAAVLTSRASDWQPLGLVLTLGVGTVVSGTFPLEVRGVKTTGTSIGIVLSMALLGPAPAATIGVLAMLAQSVRLRPPVQTVVGNLFTFSSFPLLGGFLFRFVADAGLVETDWALAIAVSVTFLLANFVNFLLLEIDLKLTRGASFRRDLREVYAPVIPVEIASALLTASMAAIYQAIGMGIAAMLVLVGLVFQYLLYTTLTARQRGEQLEERNRELAALQFGLISTTMKTLALRDHMTARHSAAVARYAREMAKELGLPTEEQELFHTAGLFHDIGKFIFPDTILFAGKGLTEKEYAIVRRHPEVGADLIAEIEGYGPVARIVRHHHERIDGKGYPFGLRGDQIPLGARVIAVADVYDVLTARDTYRQPVSSADAFAELRRSAGTQLDEDLVESFIGLVTRRGVVFSHSSSDDFEAELALERRVSDYAAPRLVA